MASIVQDNQGLSPTTCATNVLVETPSPKRRNQLLGKKHEQASADSCQHEVVDLEQCVEFEGLAVAHDFTSSENDADIKCDHGYGFPQC